MSLYYKLFGADYITGKYDKTIELIENNVKDFLNVKRDGFFNELYDLPKDNSDLFNFHKLFKLTQVNLKNMEKRLPELLEKFDDNIIIKSLAHYPELQNLLYLIPSLVYTNGLVHIAKVSTKDNIELMEVNQFNTYKKLNSLLPIYRTHLFTQNNYISSLRSSLTGEKLFNLDKDLSKFNTFYKFISSECNIDFETSNDLYLFPESPKYINDIIVKNIPNARTTINYEVKNLSNFNYLELLKESIRLYLDTNETNSNSSRISLGRIYFLSIIYYLVSNCNTPYYYKEMDCFKEDKLSILPKYVIRTIHDVFDKNVFYYGEKEFENSMNTLMYELFTYYENTCYWNHFNSSIDFSEIKEKWINDNYTNLLSGEENKQLKTLACSYMDNIFNTVNDNIGIINTKLTDFFNHYNSKDYSNLYTEEE